MKEQTIKIYRCEFCNKIYQRKNFCIQHEKMCNNNPENNRACLSECDHLKHKDAKVYIGIDNYYNGEPIYIEKSLFYCEKKKVFVYHPKSEHKGNYYSEFYDETQSNNPMPKECDDYQLNNYGMRQMFPRS